MKKIGLSLLVAALVMHSLVFASTPTSGELKTFSTKLENHKTSLLNKLSSSQLKLQKISQENTKFKDISLYKAALCLGVLTGENQNLDYLLLTNNLKTSILNQYIKLDGDIKRMQFGLSTTDSLVFGNNLDSFYNQNALKLSNLENDYYTKVTQIKNDFLEYVKNNEQILVSLSSKMDAMAQIDKAFSGAQKSFSGLSQAISKQTKVWNSMKDSRVAMKKTLEGQLDQIMNDVISHNQVSGDLQAKFLMHKQNFLTKFDIDSSMALYALFTPYFDYSWYLKLTENYQNLHKTFDISTGVLNCPILLTSTVDFSPYLRNLDKNTSALITGMDKITETLNSGKFRLKDFEASISGDFSKKITLLDSDLVARFRLMLASELPNKKQEASSTSGAIQEASQPPVDKQIVVAKTYFTQAFKRGQYHEQVKALQTLLKSRGFYQGVINGVYDKTTIESVYQFQLKHGIITGKEKNKSGYGRFGTQTRAKVNALQ